MKIPIEIKKIIGDKAFNIDTVGLSDSQVFCFDDIVLKIQNNNYEARSEIRILNWLNGRELVPKVICSHIEDGKSYLLMSKIKGKMSCEREFLSGSVSFFVFLFIKLPAITRNCKSCFLHLIKIGAIPLRYSLSE